MILIGIEKMNNVKNKKNYLRFENFYSTGENFYKIKIAFRYNFIFHIQMWIIEFPSVFLFFLRSLKPIKKETYLFSYKNIKSKYYASDFVSTQLETLSEINIIT